MKPSGKCSKCGGGVTRMLPSAPDNLGVWSRGGALPDAWVMAYVCRQCGFIEFYAEGAVGFLLRREALVKDSRVMWKRAASGHPRGTVRPGHPLRRTRGPLILRSPFPLG